MRFYQAPARLLFHLRESGVVGTFRRMAQRFFPRAVPPHPFDLAHGIDTGGLIPTQIGAHPNAAHGTAYWGTAPSLLRGALARWTEYLAGTPYSPSDYTFIDLGCGKGRALMLASETPFARILGVELDPDLAAAAQRNLAIWTRTPHACSQIEAMEGDALAFTLPPGALLLYIYNPFNDHILQQLLKRLHELGSDSPIDILYLRPEHAEVLDQDPAIQSLWKGEIPYTPEDTAADVFDTTQQQCFIYRLPGSAPSQPLA